jgi:putative flippase GtrA
MQNWRRIGMFLLAGGLNTVFGFAVYALFVYLRFPLWATVTLSLVFALMFNYLTYGGMVFKDLSWRNLPRFIAFYVALAALNTALLQAMQGLGPLVAQAILTLPLAALSYLGLSYFVFPKSN